MKNSPIEIDEFIASFLEKIQTEYEKKFPFDSKRAFAEDYVVIKTNSRTDKFYHSPEMQEHFGKFKQYMTQEDVLQFLNQDEILKIENGKSIFNTHNSDTSSEIDVNEENWYLRIKDIDFIRNFRKNYCSDNVAIYDTEPIKFEETNQIPRLVCGDKSIELEHGTIEQCFCRVMFRFSPNELVSWDLINDEIHGTKSPNSVKKDRQAIKDTRRRLTEKIKVEFQIEGYFVAHNNSILRIK
ncbi:MAG: hypothetical protein JWP09_437 [Candidatus Taylorbacteria bacterium]|nr:hypothetical protein [Candidatus Taylorbacteria bacterium]